VFAIAIYADRDALFSEDAGEGRAGELRALIGIDDLGFAVMSQGVFECLDAETSRRGYPSAGSLKAGKKA